MLWLDVRISRVVVMRQVTALTIGQMALKYGVAWSAGASYHAMLGRPSAVRVCVQHNVGSLMGRTCTQTGTS